MRLFSVLFVVAQIFIQIKGQQTMTCTAGAPNLTYTCLSNQFCTSTTLATVSTCVNNNICTFCSNGRSGILNCYYCGTHTTAIASPSTSIITNYDYDISICISLAQSDSWKQVVPIAGEISAFYAVSNKKIFIIFDDGSSWLNTTYPVLNNLLSISSKSLIGANFTYISNYDYFVCGPPKFPPVNLEIDQIDPQTGKSTKFLKNNFLFQFEQNIPIVSDSTGKYNIISLFNSCNGSKLLLSNDYGVNWSEGNSTLALINIFDVNDTTVIAFPSVMISQFGSNSPLVYRSVDFGIHWIPILRKTSVISVGGYQLYPQTGSSDKSGRYIVVVCNFNYQFGTAGVFFYGAVYISVDYGESWQLSKSLSTSIGWFQSISSYSGQYVAVSGVGSGLGNLGVIYYSSDFGSNFNLITGFPQAGNFYILSISNSITFTGFIAAESIYTGGPGIPVNSNNNIYVVSFKSTLPSVSSSIAPSSLPTRKPSVPSFRPTRTPSKSPSAIPTTLQPISVLTSLPTSSSPTSASTLAPSTLVTYKWDIILEISSENVFASCSKSGQYLIALSMEVQAGLPIYLSSNSGMTWSTISSPSSPDSGWASATLSSTGQYIAVSGNSGCVTINTYSPIIYVYISNDYGSTWFSPDIVVTGEECFGYLKILMSSSGAIMNAITGSSEGPIVFFSSINYGLDWKLVDIYTEKMALSGSGQYSYSLVQSTTTNFQYYLSISNDYQQSWSLPKLIIDGTSYCHSDSNNVFKIVTSESGKNILVIVSFFCSEENFFYFYVYISSDYGETFKASDNLYNFYNGPIYDLNIDMSSTGQYVVMNIIYINSFVFPYLTTSNNYGWSWVPSYDFPVYNTAINGDGGKIIATGMNGYFGSYSSTGGIVYIGTSGLTYSPSFKATMQPSNSPTGPIAEPTISPTYNVQYTWSLNYQTGAATNLYVSSSDVSGSILAAVPTAAKSGQFIYVSNDGVNTWGKSLTSSPSNGWKTIKISSTGQYFVVTTGPGVVLSSCSQVYYSINSGSTFTVSNGLPNIINGYWILTNSNSGQYVYAILISGISQVYISNNYGMTFSPLTNTTANVYYSGIVTSTTGQNVTVINGITLYQSYNYGKSWVTINPGFYNCRDALSLASSVSGKFMVVMSPCSSAVYIYISSNYGKTWTLSPTYLTLLYYPSLISLSMSSSGRFVSASFQTNGVYVSADYGYTWTLETGTPTGGFSSISMVGDGAAVIAGTPTGDVYLGTSSSIGLEINTKERK